MADPVAAMDVKKTAIANAINSRANGGSMITPGTPAPSLASGDTRSTQYSSVSSPDMAAKKQVLQQPANPGMAGMKQAMQSQVDPTVLRGRKIAQDFAAKRNRLG